MLEDVREIIIEQLGKPADEVRPTLIQSRHIVVYLTIISMQVL